MSKEKFCLQNFLTHIMFLLIIKFITLDEETNRTQGKLDNVQIKWGLKHVIELEEQIFTGQILSPCKDQFSSCHMQMCSNSCPSSQWCHPTIPSSVVPFSSCLQSFLASGSFPMNQFFASGGQSFGASVSASVLPVNIQGWFPLGLTGWLSLQSNGLSRVFSNTTVKRHQFFSTQLSLWSNSHIYWKNHRFD